MILDRQRGHGEAMRARRGIAVRFEGLPPCRDVEHAVPFHRLLNGEDGFEVTAMEGIEGAAADADSHIAGTGSAGSSMTRFSRTKRASLRTSSRTFSPTTAEISK